MRDELPVVPTPCSPWAELARQAEAAEAAGQLRKAEVKLLEAYGVAFEHPGAEPVVLVEMAHLLAEFYARRGHPEDADLFARQSAALSSGAALEAPGGAPRSPSAPSG
jgi:hypothetical protein